MIRYWLVACILFFQTGYLTAQEDLSDLQKVSDKIRKSLVRIQATSRWYNFAEPWQTPRIRRGTGTGFIVSDRYIMTNAHVIAQSVYLEATREQDSQPYPAKVVYVAHDCDLAIIEVQDPKFYEGSEPLSFGDVPLLNSSVTAYGYPIGGKRMSITRGIVSRIEFNPYSHSRLDSHLTIQIDAAINPGNSGGPIIQDGKVVGVAFQGITRAQNTGYMIPTPVVNRFLEDIKSGSYDGYVELGASVLNLANKSIRRYFNLPENNNGVMVTNVLPETSVDGVLKSNDILLSIDGFKVDNFGNIRLGNEIINMAEVVERKYKGDKISLVVLREGKQLELTATLTGADAVRIYGRQFDKMPRYALQAGLLFQPVNNAVVQAHKIEDLDLIYEYSTYVTKHRYVKQKEMVALTNILEDEVNIHITSGEHSLVSKINGLEINSLADVPRAFAKNVDMHVIELKDKGLPIIIDASKVEVANKRIQQRYRIPHLVQLKEGAMN